MEIEVYRIIPNEDMPIEVRIMISDEVNSPHNCADLTIFVERKDYTLSEIKRVALEKAREFLSQVQFPS